MAGIILNQTVIMFILILGGIICYKVNIISETGTKELSKLVLNIVNPVVILMAYQTEYKSKLLKGLIISFFLSIIAFAVAFAVSYTLIQNKNGKETDIERFSAIYSNCGFMGIPLVNALLGYEGVLYLTSFLTVFNILVWTHGVIQISGVKSFKSVVKALQSPAIVTIFVGLILFLLKIMLPDIVLEALDFVGSMNTPLAMIVAGATIARTELFKALKKIRIYWITLIKLLTIPLILAVLFRLIQFDSTIEIAVLVAMSAPSATICTLQCLNYGKNSLYASEIFAVTTLLSALTMPLVVYIYQM